MKHLGSLESTQEVWVCALQTSRVLLISMNAQWRMNQLLIGRWTTEKSTQFGCIKKSTQFHQFGRTKTTPLTKAGDMEHIWPMYGNDMGWNMGHIWRWYGFDMGYALPYETHRSSLSSFICQSIVLVYGIATYFVKIHTIPILWEWYGPIGFPLHYLMVLAWASPISIPYDAQPPSMGLLRIS